MSLWWWLPALIVMLAISARYAWWKPALPDDLPRVLMYHMISPQGTSKKHRGLRVDPTMFERQIAWLASNGWEFVTLSTLTRRFRGGKQVAITFDDGYEDNALNALPVLQKYGAKATLYLVVDRTQRLVGKEKAHHNTGELAAEPKLSDAQVRQLIDSGVFELGGHTLTHCHCPVHRWSKKRKKSVPADASWKKPFKPASPPLPIRSVCSAPRMSTWCSKPVSATRSPPMKVLMEPVAAWQTLGVCGDKVSGKDNFWAFKIRMRIGFRGYL